MKLTDSRRLTGASLLLSGAGAVIDVEFSELPVAGRVLDAWSRRLDEMLAAVGWAGAAKAIRRYPGGASLAFEAPVDALYAATEINEWAWEAAVREAGDVDSEAAAAEFDAARDRLLAAVDAERNPALPALLVAAEARGIGALWDDDITSVGLGRGSRSWPTTALPAPADVPWDELHDIPVVLVTGTNGKTTTVRLLAAIAQAAGLRAGFSSTDGIWVGEDQVEDGDYSGPGGAREVLRRVDVDLAVLETARGGLLRRGLPVRRAEVALVTNAAEDHLGEYGIFDLEALADAKMLVALAGEHLVINAEDERLARRAEASGRPITWFALDADHPRVLAARGSGGRAAILEDGLLRWCDGERSEPILPVDSIPLTLGGAARHNVANALAASAAAIEIGLSLAAVRDALSGFIPSPETTLGRLNVFEIGGVTALVDFAHNPHGVDAMLATAAEMPAGRRLVLIGQAGDRDDESIRALARSAWRCRPDRIVVKEMPRYLRGRELGEIPGLLSAELSAAGAPTSAYEVAPSEIDAVRRAFEWARPGDLLLLLIQADRAAVYELIDELQTTQWSPGEALPQTSP